MHHHRFAPHLFTIALALVAMLAGSAAAQIAPAAETPSTATPTPTPASAPSQLSPPPAQATGAGRDAAAPTLDGGSDTAATPAEATPPTTAPAPPRDLEVPTSAGTTSVTATPTEATPAAKPGASVKADENGFSLRGAGDPPAFVLKFGATLQVDGRAYFDDRQKDNILLRRVRPILAGTLIGLVDFYVMPDFGGGQVVLFDSYLDAHPFPWLRLRAGKFKAPIGLERLQSDADLPLPERALTSNLSPVRDVGAEVWGEIADGIVTYALAVLDGSPDNGNFDLDVGGNKDLAGRLFIQPLKRAPELGVLGVGLAATTGGRNGSAKATSLAPFKSVGQTALFSYLAPTADAMGTSTVFASGRESRVNPELYYYYAGFGLMAEAIWTRQELHKGSERGTLVHRAGHATASYVIGGRNGFNGPTPDDAWNPEAGHYGALEIAARYSAIEFASITFPDFADPAASARRASNFGAALTWVLSRMAQIGVNLEHTELRGASKTGNRKAENLLLSRAQLNF